MRNGERVFGLKRGFFCGEACNGIDQFGIRVERFLSLQMRDGSVIIIRNRDLFRLGNCLTACPELFFLRGDFRRFLFFCFGILLCTGSDEPRDQHNSEYDDRKGTHGIDKTQFPATSDPSLTGFAGSVSASVAASICII